MGSKSEVIEPKEKLAIKVIMVNLFKAALSSLGSLLSTIVRGGGLFLFLSLVRLLKTNPISFSDISCFSLFFWFSLISPP